MGLNVLHPMGWDAFGLPAEQYAIQTGTHPAITTQKNCETFRRQIQSLGLSYDWDREINTTDAKYFNGPNGSLSVYTIHGLIRNYRKAVLSVNCLFLPTLRPTGKRLLFAILNRKGWLITIMPRFGGVTIAKRFVPTKRF